MLDLEAVDLDDLTTALEDHSYDRGWWLDPESGEVVPWSECVEEQGEPDPEARGLIPIEAIPSHLGYSDMEDFIERVRDPRPRGALARAIAGRGAFRRFKDTLLEFPELREAWFGFHDVRVERRAIEWLLARSLIDSEAAGRALAERKDPEMPAISGSFDADEIARAIARDLRELYGDRLRKVLLIGSWARGEAHLDSDIDLLVVLDRVESGWEEAKRMDEILWRHSFENDTVVTSMAVAEDELGRARRPVLIRAQAEGRLIA